MNYQESLAVLGVFGVFGRGGPYSRNPQENLPRELRLLELLGNPQQDFTCTLIAGTKGKGSTATMIEQVLRQAGLRTGLYTQPDLHTFRERIRVRGQLISEGEVAELLPEVRDAVERIQQRAEFGPFITYEVTTALAFLYFARQKAQHSVLEIGLGGRLDATNVVQPLVSVITSISYDHMEILGDTLTKIATEKAGIIRPSGTLVTSAQAPEALLAIASICQQQQSRMIRVGSADADPALAEVVGGQLPALSYRYYLEQRDEQRQKFTITTPERTYSGLEIPLAGMHQLENATAALAALEMLREKGVIWDEAALRAGFQQVRWPARIDVVNHQPTIVVDGAHNADSMQKLMLALQDSFVSQRTIVVLSVARDKDLVGIVKALAGIHTVVITRMLNPRAATIEQLETLFAQYAPDVRVCSAIDTAKALNLALDLAESNDLICATGSLYLAAEALRWAALRGNVRAAEAIEGIDH